MKFSDRCELWGLKAGRFVLSYRVRYMLRRHRVAPEAFVRKFWELRLDEAADKNRVWNKRIAELEAMR